MYDKNCTFQVFGPPGALGGPWGAPGGPGIGIGIDPFNFCKNFEWKNDITLYCRTKTENVRFWPPMELLGAIKGPLWSNMGPCGPFIGIGIGPLIF